MSSQNQSIKQRFGIVGDSALLNHAISTAYQVSPTDISVLITGESGVGKEIFSQIIHNYSNRKHEKFIAVNCGAIPEGTIDSELFGHEKGSFTGAYEARKGYFETLNGGTIFLDEVGEMPLGTQARLLRVLETGEFIKVGASKVFKTDVRVIAATNINLLESIAKGKFREDLYYRLNTVSIQIPALRDRSDDVPLLFRKFAVDFAERYKTTPVTLDEDAQELLKTYTWPGNIRQLKNIAEQVSVLEHRKYIEGNTLIKYIPKAQSTALSIISSNSGGSSDLNEREILYRLLFEMKNDLNELKKVVAHIVEHEDIQSIKESSIIFRKNNEQDFDDSSSNDFSFPQQPIIRNTPDLSRNLEKLTTGSTKIQDIEENLTLEDLEKNMIIKALQKHNGRRKNAALELGISERTLYRKIKEYNLEF